MCAPASDGWDVNWGVGVGVIAQCVSECGFICFLCPNACLRVYWGVGNCVPGDVSGACVYLGLSGST